eukprot:6750466-Pyramimonas_sp.AAC.1
MSSDPVAHLQANSWAPHLHGVTRNAIRHDIVSVVQEYTFLTRRSFEGAQRLGLAADEATFSG